MTSLPDAVMREREALMAGSLLALRQEGYRITAAHDMPGYLEPDRVLIHVLNIRLQPDISAVDGDRQRPLAALVEVSSALTEEAGRRWQALHAWSREHRGEFVVFVHPEDEAQARTLARYWHLDPGCVRAIVRH